MIRRTFFAVATAAVAAMLTAPHGNVLREVHVITWQGDAWVFLVGSDEDRCIAIESAAVVRGPLGKQIFTLVNRGTVEEAADILKKENT